MRGAHGGWTTIRDPTGIIPADAGSTDHSRVVSSMKRDHPRGCGEHLDKDGANGMASGSSPRMRGAPANAPPKADNARIIPADAGSTSARLSGMVNCGDHPRGCGEHLNTRGSGLWGMGSSPRMRGALSYEADPDQKQGIIPADAGSTGRIYNTMDNRWDHPRGCGEHLVSIF